MAEHAPASEDHHAAPGVRARTLCEAFQRSAATAADRTAIRTPDGTVTISWAEYESRVARIAAALAELGVRRGATVGIMLRNMPEFHLIDAAALHLGAIPFSLYVTSAPEQLAHVLRNSECRIVFVESQFLARIHAASTPNIEHIIVVDGDEGLTLDRLEARADPGFDLASAARAVHSEDVATLIYTSGTTGPPKGVELTHANLMFAIGGCDRLAPLRTGGSLVSYLPHAHLADRLVAHYVHMATASVVTTVADPTQVIGALPSCRPSMFMAVPRVWEKLRTALLAQLRDHQSEQAIHIGLHKVRAEQNGEPVSAELMHEWKQADETVFRGIREQIGLDQTDWVISGAAPIPPTVLEFFSAIGIPICEGWGLSETTALGAINHRDAIRIGTVGRPMPNTELRLDDDGEVLVRGQHVMRGYRQDTERTAEVLDPDGWFRTGDIGKLDEHGYLVIVDRKKDIIINSAGKNMSPANIEATLLSSSELLSQACCIGDGRPFNVALLVPSPEGVAAYARTHGLLEAPFAELVAGGHLDQEISAAVARANSKLSRVEQIKGYRLLATEWLPDGDELTPTSKLKRAVIASKYADTIADLYAAGKS
ncbi:AMP-dependent synthetase/ligase [Tamaricihabitans halophyticus]|nr:long-chain fatty acid--CoA ligase [Tamaricihabitans halophyticus]